MNAEEQFTVSSWDEIKTHDLEFIVSKEQLVKLLAKTGNSVDVAGYIIDSASNERIQSIDGGEVKIDEVGGLLKGSKVFIKKNVASFSQYLIEKKLR